MAAVALQRELDAYTDAIGKYVNQARRYKTSATEYNKKVDAYNAFVAAKTAGNYGDFDPNVFYADDRGRYLVRSDLMQEIPVSQLSNYYVRHLGSNKYVLKPKQGNDMSAPGAFTMKQPTSPGPAPTATAAQMKKLDQPSLTDIERNQPSGLISSQFNF